MERYLSHKVSDLSHTVAKIRQIWTSELIRTHQTTQDVIGEKFRLPQLNEINGGDFDGLSYEEIAEVNPIEFANRDQDKLRYRYPNGESYIDVCR